MKIHPKNIYGSVVIPFPVKRGSRHNFIEFLKRERERFDRDVISAVNKRVAELKELPRGN